MRDLLIVGIVFVSLFYILRKTHIGIYVWSWIGYMNPHKLTWGFAYNFPLAQVVAITTLVSMLFNKEKKQLPINAITITLLLFIFWMGITTIFSIYPADAWEQYQKVLKIQMIVLLSMLFINSKERVIIYVWIIALSIGFYGFKGGLFTIQTAGGARVWGPPGGFIAGNNEIALALLMVIPLLAFLARHVTKRWQKSLLYLTIFLCLLSVAASYSRGAFIAGTAVTVYWVLKSRYKLLGSLLGCLLLVGVVSMMPEKYIDRLSTIQNYTEDASALGRINAWWTAINIAKERVTGGGFEHWSELTFARYAPHPDKVHDAHSIYFEVLGEHGFVGLGLFVLLFFFVWKALGDVERQAKRIEQGEWATDLAKMVKVSLIAYASGGAFLGLAYFDLPYSLAVITLVLRAWVTQGQSQTRVQTRRAARPARPTASLDGRRQVDR